MPEQRPPLNRVRALLGGIRAFPRAFADIGRVYGRAAALLARTSPRLTAGYLAVAAVLVGLPVAQVWLVKVVVDRLAAATGANGSIGLTDRAMVPALLYALTLVLPALLEPIQWTLEGSLDNRAVGVVDRELMRAGERLPDTVRIERPAFHDELRLVQQATLELPRLFPFLYRGIGTALTVVGLLLLLASLHPLLPVLLAAAAIPHLAAERRQQDLVFQAMQDHSRPAREMDYYVGVATEPASAKEVRVFGLGDFFLGQFHDRHVKARTEMTALRLRHLRVALLFGALNGATLAGGLWYVAARAEAGTLTAGDVALYLNAIIQIQAILFGTAIWFGGVYGMLPHLRGLFRFQDEAGPGIAVAAPGAGHPVPASPVSGIALHDVAFAYPETTDPVLRDVVALLPAGKITALVGANGAGKSTLVKLLTRMYDPTAGRIALAGVDLRVYDLADLRRHIAVVYQDFARFALTLGENIAVGHADGEPAGRVAEAGRWAGVDQIADGLERGYDTELTRRFEGGVDLSGGEWQKVALARGVVRDAPLVILDEPNAALDADAEHRMLERFRDLAVGRTVLLISHRLSTVRMADHILVLEDGRVVEAGGHDELIGRGGRYATLFEMQAGRYREG